MSILQAFTVKGRGPTGSSIASIDERGFYDEQKAAVVNTYKTVNAYNQAADGFVWICQEGIWQVAYVGEAHTVVGGSNYAVQVVHCAQGVAIASGTAQLSAALDLTVTAPAKSYGTLIASPTQFTRGDVLGLDMSGTVGSYAGVISILMKKISN